MSNKEVKVVLLGYSSCGKTCLFERFVRNKFDSESVITIGSAYSSKKVVLNDNRNLILGVWDTAGSERYDSLTRLYYRGAEAGIVCYDVIREEAWEKVQMKSTLNMSWMGVFLRQPFIENCSSLMKTFYKSVFVRVKNS